FDHFIDDVGGLAFGQRRFAKDLPLFIDDGGVDLFLVDAERPHGGDVHAHVFGRFIGTAFDLHEHAADGGRVMAVAAGGAFQTGDAADIEHFADAIEHVVLDVAERLARMAGRGPY